MGALAPGMVHDFSNLLTIADGWAQMRRMDLDPPDPASLEGASAHCRDLIQAFQGVFGSKDSGFGGWPDELEALATLIRAGARGRGLRVRVDRDAAPPLPGGNDARIRRAFLLLLLSEIDRGSSHGAGGELTLRAMEAAGICSVEARFDGPWPREGRSVATDELADAGLNQVSMAGARARIEPHPEGLRVAVEWPAGAAAPPGGRSS